MQSLQGKTVMIVGGSSGIGFATASAALEIGATVTIASRNGDQLRQAASSLGTKVKTAELDILDNDGIVETFARLGGFDHVIVTAAQTKGGPVRSLPLEDAYAAMQSKFWGAYRIARAVTLNEGGSLTLTSGFLSQRPSPKSVLQGAINAAIEGLVRGLALEFAPLRVNAVSPGLIDTTLYAKMPADAKAEMLARTKEKLPVQRVGAADDVAQAILMLAANPYITGSVVTVDGGGTIAL